MSENQITQKSRQKVYQCLNPCTIHEILYKNQAFYILNKAQGKFTQNHALNLFLLENYMLL